ncbi:MAG: redoxin domain-containing protein [Pirellulales bacterium]|nr:redoxin domain-containing protein [Pirellulales bacterium]
MVHRRLGRCFAPLLLALASAAHSSCLVCADDQAAPVVGRHVDDFELADYRGKEYRLTDYAFSPVVVIGFLGTECPLARIYARRLNELVTEFAPAGVVFLAIDPNQQDSLAELAELVAEFHLQYPLLKDPGNVVADRFGIRRTPEFCVLDAERVVRYHGRIDDQYEIGTQRTRPNRRDLALAIEQVLARRPVEIAQTNAPGCLIGRVRQPQPDADVTWSEQIAPLLQAHCQECHRPGQIGPFSLLTYAEAVGWADMIGEVVAQRRMPPWHAAPEYGTFANNQRLTDEQLDLVQRWVKAGAPEGDPARAPAARQFSPDWRIAQPDAIVPMSQRPFEVPAEGTVAYQWFYADPHFTEDKWVKAVEVRPSALEVVHHATVYLKPPDVPFDLALNERINLVGGYDPGGDPWQAPEGMAMRIPARSQLVFEMHYTPNGNPQQDCSRVGLVFADPAKVHKEIHSVMPANTSFAIPPGASNHEVSVDFTFPANALVLAMRPHLHLRGKAFRFAARYPDGSEEILLDVPRYDFNWQYNYVFAEPKRLPLGTKLHCTAWYDNSVDNPANPDPAATVRWGDQTWQEMMIGIFAMALADEDRLAPKPTASPPLPSVAGELTVAGLLVAAAVGGLWWLRRRLLFAHLGG